MFYNTQTIVNLSIDKEFFTECMWIGPPKRVEEVCFCYKNCTTHTAYNNTFKNLIHENNFNCKSHI